jgi:proteic killer suppression protein
MWCHGEPLGRSSALKEMIELHERLQYSIRINDQWRICFTWKDDGPHEVEIVAYH